MASSTASPNGSRSAQWSRQAAPANSGPTSLTAPANETPSSPWARARNSAAKSSWPSRAAPTKRRRASVTRSRTRANTSMARSGRFHATSAPTTTIVCDGAAVAAGGRSMPGWMTWPVPRSAAMASDSASTRAARRADQRTNRPSQGPGRRSLCWKTIGPLTRASVHARSGRMPQATTASGSRSEARRWSSRAWPARPADARAGAPRKVSGRARSGSTRIPCVRAEAASGPSGQASTCSPGSAETNSTSKRSAPPAAAE